MSKQIRIRATCTLKLISAEGLSLTYQYPKQCSIDELAKDLLFAIYRNKGADGCLEFVKNSINTFESYSPETNQ